MALLAFALFETKAGHFPGKYALLPVLGAMLLIAAGPKAFGNRLLTFKPAIWIGLISYPLYLWHWPLISYTHIILGARPDQTFRIGMFATAFALAALTYWLVERPIRFGKYRGTKAVALLAALVIVGGMGTWVYVNEGLPERPANEQAKKILKEDFHFQQLFTTDDTCKRHYGNKFQYCRYRNMGGEYTVALLGDSHAIYTFLVVSEYLAQQGYNTLAIADGGGFNPVNGILTKPDAMDDLFEQIGKDKSIKKVFLITRGVVYITGLDLDISVPFTAKGMNAYYGHSSGLAIATQKTINRLRQFGIAVYLVAENPVLPKGWRLHQNVQPLRNLFYPDFNTPNNTYSLTKTQVLEHQKEYLEMIARLEDVTVLDSIDAFCPKKGCLLFDENGFPLYLDSNHLSQRTGGQFLLDKVLKPHLLPSK
ncbi:MAG: acyltransferase [Azoarcus sp.]|jgi:hypothetical protein|nr:acyltransferase [Azoarcus sp.]